MAACRFPGLRGVVQRANEVVVKGFDSEHGPPGSAYARRGATPRRV